MVLNHSCSAPRPWSVSTGEMISSRVKVCVYLRGKPLSCVKLVGKWYQGALLYLEELSPLFTAKLQPVLCTLLPSLLLLLLSLLLPLPFSQARMHAPSLLLAHSHLTHTHLTHSPIPESSYATFTMMQETHRQNLNPILFHWSLRCGSILDFQWVMLTVFVVDKKSTVCNLCRN